MSVLLISRFDPDEWVRALVAHLPGVDLRVYPDVGDPAAIEVALVHRPRPGLLKTFPNLKAVVGLFAGVDAMVNDPDLPDVPFSRMVDPLLTRDVAHYIVLHTLRHYREQPLLEAGQRDGRWAPRPPPSLAATVGIMGMGEIGGLAGRMLLDLGFSVRGWSRTPKSIPGVESFAGRERLPAFLAGTHLLAMALPLTAATAGILNRTTLAALPPGAAVINAGRGGHVVDADLLTALDRGHIAHATLDVFSPEPPPADHPFWRHPKVTITPHTAGDPRPESVAALAADNVRRALAGKPLLYPVDRARGY